MSRFIDKLLKRTWSDEDVTKYVGAFETCKLTYALDAKTRKKAASGGSTSAFLIHLLRSAYIDGAIVCKTMVVDGKVRTRFVIAKTEDEILSAQGSKYVETGFVREVPDLIRKVDGRFAVVGLPCDLTFLRGYLDGKPELSQKVLVMIALLCGHNSKNELIDFIASKLEKETGSRLTNYRFRVGHWRGNLEAEFENGETVRKATSYFNNYQNVHFYSLKKCLSCHDHYGYDSDISVGDVWLYELKNDPMKYTGAIVRTTTGRTLFESAVTAGALHAEPVAVRKIMDGQSRAAPAHYNVTARAKAARIYGIRIKDRVNERVSMLSFVNAFLTVTSYQMSCTRIGQRVISVIPGSVIRLYLYVKKALEVLG